MRWCIVGAGAIGGVLSARLQAAGEDVVVVARGANLAAIRTHGLTLVDGDGRHRVPLRVAADLVEADPATADAVLLAVKSQHTRAVLEELVDAGAPDRPVICAQNGVENERQALRWFPRVYAMSVSLLASHLEPGVVVAHSAPVVGRLHLGRYPGGTDAFADAAVASLDRAGFAAHARADVMSYKWAKLLVNLVSGVEALCGPTARTGQLATLVVEEGRRCLDATDIEVPDERELTPLVPGSRIAVAREGGSTWQSLRRGAGDLEADYLNGEIVLLGRLHGIGTPANALVQRRLRELSRQRGAAGSIEETALLAALP